MIFSPLPYLIMYIYTKGGQCHDEHKTYTETRKRCEDYAH